MSDEPCPEKKGHCCEGCAFFCGAILVAFVLGIIGFITVDAWQKWGIRNGLAAYNPTTGYLEWKDKK